MGYAISHHIYQKMQGNAHRFHSLFWGVLAFSWIGSKVMFLAYNSFPSLGEYVNYSHFWLGGGFVFYGGLIAGILYIYFYCRITKKSFYDTASIFPIGIGIGHAIGRIGCFMAGCCYGTACSLPWSVYLHGKERHPTQLYEVSMLIAISVLMWRLINKNYQGKKLFCLYLLSYSTGRFLIEFFRGDITQGNYLADLTIAQIVSIAIMIFSGAMLIPSSWMRRSQ